MKYSPLGSTGMVVSVMGLGGSAFGGAYGDLDEEEALRTVDLALRSGVNYIDTAVWYGNGRSEAIFGKALSRVPRQAYYIATKACRYEPDVLQMFDFSSARTLRSVDESLARLGVDYVDVIQVHDPEFSESLATVLEEALPALDTARKGGKARCVGITGYPLDMQKELIERSTVKIDTSLCYCHYSLNDRTLLDFLPVLKQNGIAVINASALGMGLLSEGGPPVWHPATEDIKVACAEAVQHCKALGLDISKLALHFSMHTLPEELPVCLVSSHVHEFMAANIATATQALTAEEESAIEFLKKNIFSRLGKCTWEGIEVAKYRRKLAEKKAAAESAAPTPQ